MKSLLLNLLLMVMFCTMTSAQALSLQNPWDYNSSNQNGYKNRVAQFKKSKTKTYVAQVADYADDLNTEKLILVDRKMSFFFIAGPNGVQDNQNALLVSRRKQLTLGPSIGIGGMFKTNDKAYIYASGAYSQIYDHEFGKTSHMTYDVGAMYKPNFFGIGAGIRALTRPQLNQGDIGVHLKAMFTYPLADRLEFITIVEYGAPIIERTTKGLYAGIKYAI